MKLCRKKSLLVHISFEFMPLQTPSSRFCMCIEQDIVSMPAYTKLDDL